MLFGMAKVVYLVQDLLFASKIREVAKQVGVEAASLRDPEALAQAAADAQLVILDLRHSAAPRALELLQSSPVSKVGFIDHEKVDVMEAAREKGCRAYAKGAFAKELPSLLAAL
jgi:hypothetical protein